MSTLRRSRFLLFLSLVALVAALTGCDSNEYDDPRDRPAMRSFEVTFDLDEASFEGPIASIAYDAPEITREVVRNGMVMAYVREADTWTALPYTYGVEAPDRPAVDYTVTLGHAHDVHFFEVFYELSVNDEQVWSEIPQERRIKVVAFSGAAVQRNQHLNFRDYEAVKQHFELNP